MTQKISGGRRLELSLFNVLLCLLVIFIHVTANPISALQKTSRQWAAVFFPWRLSAFVVQGFIFLSGLKLFLNHKGGLDYKKFYAARFIKIVLPYLLWNVVYYVYFVRNGYFPFSAAALLRYIGTGTLVSPFYFIIAMIQFYALAPLWQGMVKKIHPVFALVFAAVLTFFLGQNLPGIIALVRPGYEFPYNDRVFTTYLLYWVAGCYAGLHYEKVGRILKENRAFITAVFIVFTALEAVCSYVSLSGLKYLPWLEHIHYCYCISAILFLLMVFTAIAEKKERIWGLLSGIDRASYAIFLSHCLVINMVNDFMLNAGVKSISAAYIIRVISVYSVTIAACILWSKGKDALKRK